MDNRTALAPTPEMKEQFDYPIRLEFVVTLAAHQLSTDLRVRNVAQDLDRSPLEFQALFHNYIRSNSSTVHVTPLTGLSFYDKTEATEEARATPKVEERETVDVRKFTDSVYENAPGKYTVAWKTGEIEIRTVNLKDVVVWNPQAEAGSKIGDMEDGGWCVLRSPERASSHKRGRVGNGTFVWNLDTSEDLLASSLARPGLVSRCCL